MDSQPASWTGRLRQKSTRNPPTSVSSTSTPPTPPSTPRPTSKKRKTPSPQSSSISSEPLTPKTPKPKKPKYTPTPNQTPFPTHPYPTPSQAHTIHTRLSTLHGLPTRRPRTTPGGCGDVPNVLDALIRTILSQNTTNANSTNAHKGLVKKFGSCNWDAIREAKQEEVEDAIRVGGLAKTKSRRIQAILNSVHSKYGTCTLDHLHSATDEEAMRHSFAVDTHVFRITKALGWVPQGASREEAHAHLDAKVPDELKFGLHVLFVKHGKCCTTCAARGRPQQTPVGPCPIKEFMGGVKPRDVEVKEEEFGGERAIEDVVEVEGFGSILEEMGKKEEENDEEGDGIKDEDREEVKFGDGIAGKYE
ncbi:hypothetical protein HDV00_008041 [Rhizophlyctis rosea]|nr:hypothetical protein HDV00_008041 [Rhizophlyctis rosea]